MSDMDPESAADFAKGSADPIPLDGRETQHEPSDPDNSNSLIDGLLETRPGGNVRDYPDVSPWIAHTMIGVQKFINGIAGERELSGGKPALIDFMQAGISFMSDDEGGSQQTPEKTTQEPQRAAGGPPGDVGGSIPDE